ncbi:MAG: prephenate dehydrogenase/arogenate dehydrogenase family protein [Candidatus Omnitrophica bacterium]|nr:prephenate dehydrogenase/arogenate dehydrogenase family protein [Candidatus Omnitrophota bacterium]
MKLFNKVAIIGTGLIGGSLALALKKKGLAEEIVGVSRHKKTLSLAKKMKVIDKGSQDLEIIQGADLVILATPVNTIINLAPEISKVIAKGCIVTDVGSTKEAIVSRLEKIFPRYVGSHPLAGSEKRGIASANAGIFKGSLCILTPTINTDRIAEERISNMWIKLGAKVIRLTPAAHDKILSFVSHLPHLVAFSLIGAVPGKYLKFASGGLKDTTRVAASDSELWADIFLSNQKNMAKAIALIEENLSKIKSAIKRRDKRLLIKILKNAQDKRKALRG